MSIQQIRRAIIVPALRQDMPDWFRDFVYQHYQQLSAQVNALETAHQVYQSGSLELPAITIGNAFAILTFTTPWPDLNYSVAAMPDWATIVYYSLKTVTSIKLNFSVVAPGAQNLMVIAVR
jgi:hypothetical protein